MFKFWIIFTACLVAINGSLLGSFLVLKKMSMVGDALSHSVLPGIVLAFLLTSQHGSFLSLIFASVLGVLAVWIMEFLSKKGGTQKDSAIGIVYTFLFSVGIILISAYAKNSDIDVDCVLFGDLGNVPFTEPIQVFGILFPKETWFLLLLSALIIAVMYFGWKGFVLSNFDPLLASSMGISLVFWNYLLLGLSSVSTVFSFNSVGAIMVVSMLVIPAAFAQVFTKRIKPFLFTAVSFALINCVVGFYLSFWLNVNIVASISSCMGLILLIGIGLKKWIQSSTYAKLI